VWAVNDLKSFEVWFFHLHVPLEAQNLPAFRYFLASRDERVFRAFFALRPVAFAPAFPPFAPVEEAARASVLHCCLTMRFEIRIW
jgi:hypothetical protein